MCCNDWTYQIKIGNIHERSMIDMYLNDPKLSRIRWSLLNGLRKEILPCSMCDDAQGATEAVKRNIGIFKKTQYYKFHLCKLANEGLVYTRELKGENLIPVYQVE